MRLARAVLLSRGRLGSERGGASALLAGLVLHARLGRVQVQTAVLDVLVDLLGRLQERLLHVVATEGRGK